MIICESNFTELADLYKAEASIDGKAAIDLFSKRVDALMKDSVSMLHGNSVDACESLYQ